MSPRVLVVALALLVPLAGCFGAASDAVKEKPAATNNTTTVNTTLPDGRGQSLGNLETNKTVNSTVDGKDHKHDYWKGRETVTIYSRELSFFPEPVFPDGQGSQPKSVAYVKLPNDSFVWEGSDLVTVTSKSMGFCASSTTCAPDAAAPKIRFQYRSAADSDWRDAGNLVDGGPTKIPVIPKETDMPHSVLSLWVFRLTTDNPDASRINLTIVTHRGRDVVNWPGHPDFYANGETRIVAQNKHVKTHMSGIAESFLYDQGGTWAAPDKLISYGTGKLHIIVNVTSFSTQTGAAPTGFFLETHNATIIGPEVTFGTRTGEKDKKNDLKHYEFEVPVDGAGMDGPYQPASRWGFRVMATFAQIPVSNPVASALCPGCFSYDIEYDLTVIAEHDTKAAAMVM